jgi:hypothetical protein
MPRSTPPTLPLRNFEINASRVRALIMDVHGAVPSSSRKLQSDVASAAIVMTVAAVDTYFGDRLAEDFERRFELLDEETLGELLTSIFQAGTNDFERRKFARAFQHDEPRREVVRMFRAHVDERTYQSPGVIAAELGRFGIRNVWGEVDFRWQRKFGKKPDSEATFANWARTRHAIAHRTGRKRGGHEVARRAAEHVRREDARECLNFFTRLLALVDFRLNAELYGVQPRRRSSEIAIFDLEPVSGRRTYVPARSGRPPEPRR